MWRPATSKSWRDQSGHAINSSFGLGLGFIDFCPISPKTILHSTFRAISFAEIIAQRVNFSITTAKECGWEVCNIYKKKCQRDEILSLHSSCTQRGQDGRVGSLVDDSGLFYKPLQDGSRGDKEVTFYDKIWSDIKVPPSIQSFFPKFYGTVNIDAPDGSGSNRHAIMEDLTHGFPHPCIIDVKMGARTWYPEAGEKYVKKCMKKDKQTTSEALGFRLFVMQV